MSLESERVYTINLGKVLLSPDNQRAKRAINMIKEFARHHMKSETIKIEEDVAHLVWSRGMRRPPRRIRVMMSTTSDGSILVSSYDEPAGTEPAEGSTAPLLKGQDDPTLKPLDTEPDSKSDDPTLEPQDTEPDSKSDDPTLEPLDTEPDSKSDTK